MGSTPQTSTCFMGQRSNDGYREPSGMFSAHGRGFSFMDQQKSGADSGGNRNGESYSVEISHRLLNTGKSHSNVQGVRKL